MSRIYSNSKKCRKKCLLKNNKKKKRRDNGRICQKRDSVWAPLCVSSANTAKLGQKPILDETGDYEAKMPTLLKPLTEEEGETVRLPPTDGLEGLLPMVYFQMVRFALLSIDKGGNGKSSKEIIDSIIRQQFANNATFFFRTYLHRMIRQFASSGRLRQPKRNLYALWKPQNQYMEAFQHFDFKRMFRYTPKNPKGFGNRTRAICELCSMDPLIRRLNYNYSKDVQEADPRYRLRSSTNPRQIHYALRTNKRIADDCVKKHQEGPHRCGYFTLNKQLAYKRIKREKDAVDLSPLNLQRGRLHGFLEAPKLQANGMRSESKGLDTLAEGIGPNHTLFSPHLSNSSSVTTSATSERLGIQSPIHSVHCPKQETTAYKPHPIPNATVCCRLSWNLRPTQTLQQMWRRLCTLRRYTTKAWSTITASCPPMDSDEPKGCMHLDHVSPTPSQNNQNRTTATHLNPRQWMHTEDISPTVHIESDDEAAAVKPSLQPPLMKEPKRTNPQRIRRSLAPSTTLSSLPFINKCTAAKSVLAAIRKRKTTLRQTSRLATMSSIIHAVYVRRRHSTSGRH